MGYELFISRASPYSSKIVALMGYADIPHQIRVQSAVTRYTILKRLTGKTMVPVLRRGRWAMNDSTTLARYIIERSSRPTLPVRQADTLAWLLEDFADEWMVRWMVHSRWRHRDDTERLNEVIGRELTGSLPVGAKCLGRYAGSMIRKQMKAWGVRAENDRALERSALRTLEALEAILSTGPAFLFDGYPTVADFAIYGALVQYHADPTGRQRLDAYPVVRAYIRRLDGMAHRPPTVRIRRGEPRDISELQPLFGELLGTYWSVMVANYRARADENDNGDMGAELVDGSWFRARRSGYLQGRLEAVLSLVDEAYAERDRLFGERGVRMERAFIDRIADLCESEVGRTLLQQYTHVGMH